MSMAYIQQYYSDLAQIRRHSGQSTEMVEREAFKTLLTNWGKSEKLHFVSEYRLRTRKNSNIRVDGALLWDSRLPFGYWEAKDRNTNLDRAITDKFRSGYPKRNMLFSNDVTAVLYQNGREQCRVVDMQNDRNALNNLLEQFFAYQQPEVQEFHQAVDQFTDDLPQILVVLRELIADKRKQSPDFAEAEKEFLDLIQKSINETLAIEDVQEMLIQHILTDNIFSKIFDKTDYHRHNNIAVALYDLEKKLFGYGGKQKQLVSLQPYYNGIVSAATKITIHSEKQAVLKHLYQKFYEVYNPAAADRLGVVYTPHEIVQFMIRIADELCGEHFNKNLIDRNVEILDPATGTGTYIAELLEHFSGEKLDDLHYKYENEIHANEVAVLPYYVANLNIEETYRLITGNGYDEYRNLCLVDTLDTIDALQHKTEFQPDMFGAVSQENFERIKRQNEKSISVIIGNPPYNANQRNANDNNPNRAYRHIDRRIKDTYVKASSAQKTKLYDMYVRFIRWATDRLHGDGIVAFITNRSFVDARTADGLRKELAKDFSAGYIIDLGGDYKKKGDAGGGNVFGIGTGVAISFWIKKRDADSAHPATIRYLAAPQGTSEDKLAWLTTHRYLPNLDKKWQRLRPDQDGAWLNIPNEDWSPWLPLANEETKRKHGSSRAIFKLYSMGIVSARNDWVYDTDKRSLSRKVKAFIDVYEGERKRWNRSDKKQPIRDFVDRSIKWTEELEAHVLRNTRLKYSPQAIRESLFRPFSKRYNYFAPVVTHRPYQQPKIFPYKGGDNRVLYFTHADSQKPFMVGASDNLIDYCAVGASAAASCMPRYRYGDDGSRCDNITDWGLAQFVKYYGEDVTISKDNIFAYCYAVLHHPTYRERFALNLKKEFPHIPLFEDFAQWVAWGNRLLTLHIDFEQAACFDFARHDSRNPKRAKGEPPLVKLQSQPDKETIIIDEDTKLTDIPVAAWDYMLGGRSAIDWVLDQHKERTIRDATVRERFNSYLFADYKEACIDLLARVVTISIETNKITQAMAATDCLEKAIRESSGSGEESDSHSRLSER